jgi:hypothetical protein
MYILLINTIGLEKAYGSMLLNTPKSLFMCLFFFLGMIQRRIWDHYYSRVFVEKYFKNQSRTVYSRALTYVQHYYVKKISRYLNSMQHYDIMKMRQRRIDHKVELWEELCKGRIDNNVVDTKSKNIKLIGTPFENCSMHFGHDNWTEDEIGEICLRAEDHCLKINKDIPILPLTEIRNMLIKSRKNTKLKIEYDSKVRIDNLGSSDCREHDKSSLD